MLMSGFRASQQLRSECSHSQLGICIHASSFFKTSLSPQYPRNLIAYKHNYLTSKRPDIDPINCARQQGTSCSPIIPDGLSPAEDSVDSCPYEGLSGGVVALGKFDALHIGHRELAIQASKIGVPFLMSFVGMAAILGWEPRAPIVAECDRKRVLSSWAPLCGNIAPKEVQIDFSKVRYLTPEQFVQKLSSELGVRGVVAGQNYRFGYKASGDASDLVRLCKDYGMTSCIINSVMDKNQNTKIMGAINSKDQGQVSSTRVRHALANGDMGYVSELLGRDHRLMLMVRNQKHNSVDTKRFLYPRSCLLNLAPTEGRYENCRLVIEGGDSVRCRVVIDASDICLELDGFSSHMAEACGGGNVELLGVEFGNSGF